jgi:hypothetical protein
LQHLSKLSVLASAEYGGDLVFQTVDGLLARRDTRPPLLCQDDEFRASVDVVVQVLFFLQHVLLISGQLSLSRSGALGSSTAGQVGIKIAIVGTAALALSELWAISAADAANPSRQTSVIESSFGVESLLIGVGFVLAGIAVWRAGVWGGWRRAVPLALGVYVFVVLVPGLGAGSYVLARLVIGFWMLLFALLGWLLWRFAPGPARS